MLELDRIEAALAEALRPAMTQDPAGERGFADVSWMLAKALRFLLQAARAAQDGDACALDEALAEADADLLAAARVRPRPARRRRHAAVPGRRGGGRPDERRRAG